MSLSRPLPPEDLEFVLRGAVGPLRSLKGASVLITGASGFFGRWLLESLLLANKEAGLGARVVALSRNPKMVTAGAPHLAAQGVSWIEGSVATLTPSTLPRGGIDFVVHLATEADMQATRDDPKAATDVIVGGTRRVLEVASAAGARRFLFTSSGAVYGTQDPDIENLEEARCAGPTATDVGPAMPREAWQSVRRSCSARNIRGEEALAPS